MGHRDTVFPDGEAARRPFSVRDGIAYGPGVADMKAGLVMNCFILAAFAKFGGAPAPLVGLFTGDEEIGSPEGRAVIETEARRARVVFNSEPGRVSGNVVTGRKGGVFMSFHITGKAAHSGANFSDGISAIEELAGKIQAIHALTDLERGITLNVGLVSGGRKREHRRPVVGGPDRSALREPARSQRRDGTDRRDHGTQFRTGHQNRIDRERRVPAADTNTNGETIVRTLCAVGRGYRFPNRRASFYRWLRAGLLDLPRRSGAATICAVEARSAARRTVRMSSCGSTLGTRPARAHRPARASRSMRLETSGDFERLQRSGGASPSPNVLVPSNRDVPGQRHIHQAAWQDKVRR